MCEDIVVPSPYFIQPVVAAILFRYMQVINAVGRTNSVKCIQVINMQRVTFNP